jgi:hypothetical protein
VHSERIGLLESHDTRSPRDKQLDDRIDDTLVSVDGIRCRRKAQLNRRSTSGEIVSSRPIRSDERHCKKKPVRRKTMSIIDKALEANRNYAKNYDPTLGKHPPPKS